MRKRLIDRISQAIAKVTEEIHGNAQHGSYAAGLASEGYAGGYRDALWDVTNLINNVTPRRRNYWDKTRTDGNG
jgi:hypothetical protein